MDINWVVVFLVIDFGDRIKIVVVCIYIRGEMYLVRVRIREFLDFLYIYVVGIIIKKLGIYFIFIIKCLKKKKKFIV